jgi:hypothetical protein
MRMGHGFHTSFRGPFNFFIWKQEYPYFSYVWRWKRYRQDLEFGIIVFGYWLTILLDYS